MSRAFITGAQAIVQGAVDSGCDFYAGYPITPATPILLGMVRALPPRGGIAIQAEDEIAAIGFCIGAAMTNRRAMTATSGPGMSLYSENIGFAIMAEVPLVIVDVQRMGPATGGATTPAQGDLQFVRWGTSGGFPVVALAPENAEQCYRLTVKAFELAERLRAPVFLLADKEVVMTAETVDPERLKSAGPVTPRRTAPPEGPYLSYGFDRPEDVPAFSPFGGPHVVRVNTSTHDEGGYLTKDPAKVERLNRHLVAKIEAAAPDVEDVALDLQEGADTLVVSYGVSARSAADAVREARRLGRAVSLAVVHSVWPFPKAAITRALAGVLHLVVAELNFGQLRLEVERVVEAGQRVTGVHRVDGELITPGAILQAILQQA
ncbi:MAG: pyruvate flavodoxin/ferredoxin oxidoreductase [Bacillota bacterium]